MSESMKAIFDIGLVPLVELEDAMDAVPFAKALLAGGIPVAEVMFRTPAARDTIAAIAAEVPEVIVGAGTVHTVDQAKVAVEAGAKFIVTPSFNHKVVKWCVEEGVNIVPGVVSPTDIQQAMDFGLTTLKFFPAESYGGVKTLKALAGPYADMKFMATGGVNIDNMNQYLALTNVAAVGGSFMTPSNLVKEKKWDEITIACKETVKKMLGFEIAHIGINTADEKEAKSLAGVLSSMFLQDVRETSGAFFAGSLAEVLKGSYLGVKGHFGINTCDIDRAVAYFQRVGIELHEDTWVRDEKGKLITVYFKEEFGGFAVHLRRKEK
ncbi:bifunctional 4-hydroxy-2-oxoglutarate aldolase/2-dehydro-3-deoxy-phosphogluconate aldolase [Neobacillus niacini]|uniref:bifunctional 4-hydroxy-2-oxoglutarate aldolase/2-dehydro-3-deoxy-phosphogluconate aldolase n=1 Tax=Neobacillus niacini TaxID=86668 RepID=UPI002FFDE5CF